MAPLHFLLLLTGSLNAEEFGEYQYQINGSAVTITVFLGYEIEATVRGKTDRHYQFQRHAQLLPPNEIIITATPAP